MKNLKIGTKLLIGFGTSVALLVIFGVTVYYSLGRMRIERGVDVISGHSEELEEIGDLQLLTSEVIMPVKAQDLPLVLEACGGSCNMLGI